MTLSDKYLEPFIQLILFISVIAIAKYYFDRRRLFVLGNRLPGPRYLPIIGNALDVLGKNFNALIFVNELNKKYELAAHWLGPKLHVFISTPEHAEIYFTSQYLLDKDETYELLEPAMGKGLLTSNGTQWKKARKLTETIFRYSSLKSYMDIHQEKTNVSLQLLQKEEGKPSFSIFPYIKNCTFDIICEVALPFCCNAQKNAQKIMADVEYMMAEMSERLCSVWQPINFIFKHSAKGKAHFQRVDRIRNFFHSILAEGKMACKNENDNLKGNSDKILDKKKFLEELIASKEWDDEAIVDHLITTIGSGFETTATAICFTLVMLGIHKDVQEKLYNELSTGYEEGLDEKDLDRAEYLEMVIKETLRLYTTVPMIFREATHDVQIGKHLIPKGASVGLNMFALHRNPKVYDNPDAFNPDNFLPENIKKRHPYSYVPFAAGIRKCVGFKFAMMSMSIIISKIVRNYKIECDLKMEDFEMDNKITLKMKNGEYPVRLIKR